MPVTTALYPVNKIKAMRNLYMISQYVVSFVVITYGFAKINGSQFTLPASELDKPLGEVSGFWLTWHYFGYSKYYGNLIALLQIIGGLLLLFPRTALLGTCLLFVMMSNILLIDIFYGVDIGGTLAALVIELALAFMLFAHRRELIDFFWAQQPRLFTADPARGGSYVGRYALPAAMILIPALLTYLLANYNNRSPTQIDGTWEVVDPPPASDAAPLPSIVFFERNRAYLCVFKFSGRGYESHHFEVDPETQMISIWQEWLEKGEIIFEGRYTLADSRLCLRGTLKNHSGELTLRLRKRGLES